MYSVQARSSHGLHFRFNLCQEISCSLFNFNYKLTPLDSFKCFKSLYIIEDQRYINIVTKLLMYE